MIETSDNLDTLRAAVLRFLMADGARQSYEFIEHADGSHDPRFVRRMIYALALSGLLEKLGSTSGSFYLTTRLGYIVLASLENEILLHKHHRRR